MGDKGRKLGLILALVISFLSLMTWVLLLRDERALAVITNFYPQTTSWLALARKTLLGWGLNSVGSIVFGLLAFTGFGVYLSALKSKISTSTAALFAAVFLGIGLVSYPLLSTDVFDYVLSDRQAVVYHQDVWRYSPAETVPPGDRFYNLASWQQLTNPYGSVNQLFYSIAGYFSGDDLVQSAVAHKLLVGIFYLALLILFFCSQKGQGDGGNLVAIFWNPLWILEFASSGHNDPLMLFFLVVGMLTWQKKKYLATAIVLAISVQIKFVPVFLIPILFASLLRKNPKLALAFVTVFSIVLVVLFVPMYTGLGQFFRRLSVGSSVYWQSFPQVLVWYLRNPAIKFFPLVGFGAFYLFEVFQIWRGREEPIGSSGKILLVYLLVASSVYWNWYGLWILALWPFLVHPGLKRAVVMLSLTSLIAYPLYWLYLRFGYQNPLWPAIIYLVIAGPVLFIYRRGIGWFRYV